MLINICVHVLRAVRAHAYIRLIFNRLILRGAAPLRFSFKLFDKVAITSLALGALVLAIKTRLIIKLLLKLNISLSIAFSVTLSLSSQVCKPTHLLRSEKL